MKMFCKKCGKELREDVRFCPACGCPVTYRAAKTGQMKIRPACIALGVLLLATVAVAALFFYHYRQEKLYRETVARGDFYMEKGQYDRAEEAYQEAGNIKDDDAMLYVKLGDLYRCQEAGTDTWYQRALSLEPGLKEAYEGLAGIYWESADMERFINIVEQGEKVAPNEKLFPFVKKQYEDYMRYRTYEELIEKRNNAGSGYRNSQSYIQAYGFCFAKLVDFSGDGTDELVIGYTKTDYDTSTAELPSIIDDYVLEVWDYDKGEAEQIFSGTPVSEYGEERVVFLSDGESSFLKVCNESGEIGCYGMQDGEFQNTGEKSGDMELYLLQGYALEEPAEEYLAWDEMRQTEKKLGYKKDAAGHAIDCLINVKNDMTESEALIGNYRYETADKSVYVCGYLNKENRPVLSVRYWTEEEDGTLDFVYNEEKHVYELDERYSDLDVAISLAEEEGKLSVYLQGETVGGGIQAELARETQYDITKEEQKTETEDVMKSYQLDEKGTSYAVQEFLAEKRFQTLDATKKYRAGGAEEVSRYNEAYWVPIYEQDSTEVAYYAIIAGNALENAGEGKIYSAEVYSVVQDNKKIADFQELETFDAQQYIQNQGVK